MSLKASAFLWFVVAAGFILGNLIGNTASTNCTASQDVCFHSLNR